MELKKTVLGRYSDKNVNDFISGIRTDYEKCLKDQKDRILKLRRENDDIKEELSKYKQNQEDVTLALSYIEKQKSTLIEQANNEVIDIKQKGDAITRYYRDRIFNLKSNIYEIHNTALTSLEKLILEIDDIKKSNAKHEDYFDIDADLIAIASQNGYKPKHLKVS